MTFTKGQPCLALYDDGQYYPATYHRKRRTGTHRVDWADGSGRSETSSVAEITQEQSKAAGLVGKNSAEAAIKFEQGQPCLAQADDGHFYPATYHRERSNGNYLVDWSDGSGRAEISSIAELISG